VTIVTETAVETFLCSDVEGSTDMTTRRGDDAAREPLERIRAIHREELERHKGREVDAVGDGFLAAFASPRQAIHGAIAIQRRAATEGLPAVRIGLNAGEVSYADGRPFGAAINAAARVAACASGRQVLVSDSVRQLAGTVPGVHWTDRGRFALKGFPERWRLYEVVPDDPLPPPQPQAASRRRGRVLALGGLAVVAVAVGIVALVRHAGDSSTAATIDANAVALVDPVRGVLTAQVAVGAAPSQLAAGDHAVWVTNEDDQTVSRIDEATRTVRQTITVGSGPRAIAVGEGGVWVANGLDGTVSWISPATNAVVKTIPVGNSPSGVCVTAGAVWVANAGDRMIVRIDPLTGLKKQTTPVASSPTGLACGGGAVWASSETSGTVTEISPQSGDAMRTIDVGAGASGLAFGAGSLWVANTLAGTVSRIDPRRGGVVSTIAVGAGDGPSSIAVGPGGVWVANEFAGTLARIDPRRDKIVQKLAIGQRPQALALVNGKLWIGLRASGASHRGGTLRIQMATGKITTAPVLDSADPTAYGTLVARLLSVTNDGLTAFRRVGGVGGTRLVPDLAVALPRPTDGGRTYTFQLRRGIHYATGELVRPADIRHGLERVLRAGTNGAAFYASIIGATSCTAHPLSCDLSRGIAVDDTTGTITFRLTAPDPEFLDKLALVFAVAVPRSVPMAATASPLPATGPYALDPIGVGLSSRLVRNPQFRVWSNAARPDGYPDTIEIGMGGPSRSAIRAVERGSADLAGAPSSPSRELDTLFTRFPGLVHSNSQAATVSFFLNTRVPPFNRVAARRAVNYAIDRGAAVAAAGGARLAEPTCQFLPPDFPGYQPYCPYTANPGPGRAWTAPDLAKARALVATSGTRGARVTVWGRAPDLAPYAPLAVRALNTIGYRASARLLPGPAWYRTVFDARRRGQIGTQIWGADYPAASNFLQPNFACTATTRLASNNLAGFCDRRTQRLINGALRAQQSDQTTADKLWAQVDRKVADRAAAIPLLNPKEIDVTSQRTGNYQYSPQWGVLYDQLWVR
jgi:YVTN family beta-propeller protein